MKTSQRKCRPRALTWPLVLRELREIFRVTPPSQPAPPKGQKTS